MCRIDAPFGNITFDEKNDPKERFVQALDEFKIQGNLRTLLIKHYSDTWQSVFNKTSDLEEILDNTNKYDSDAEKCIAIVRSQVNIISNSIMYDSGNYLPAVNDSAIIGFLNDVALNYYPDSPYGLFNDGIKEGYNDYFSFVSWLYGKEFCFSKSFFDDKELALLNTRDRMWFFWDVFYSIAYQFKSDEASLFNKIITLVSLSTISEPLDEDSLIMMKGLDFLKAWIKFDSQAGRIPHDWKDFVYEGGSPWRKIEILPYGDHSECENTAELVKKWVKEITFEFEKLFYISADLSAVVDEDRKVWANGVNHFFTSYMRDYEFTNYDSRFNAEKQRCLSNLYCELHYELTPLQSSIWVKCSIENYFMRLLDTNNNRSSSIDSAEQWGNKEYFITWTKVFIEGLSTLELESQFIILSSPVPHSKHQYEGYYSEFLIQWNELFSKLVEQDSFPNKLVPSWTMAAMGRLEQELLFPYIDKSIGILRGELSKVEASEEELKVYHEQLEKLLTTLDISNPTKAQRHRLLLMRSSTVPFSDETISKARGLFNRENISKWYDSLNYLADTQLAHQVNSNKAVTVENHLQVKNDFYVNFSHELAEFCLSRLRLRRGEKAKDDKYDSSQVVEQSSTWRQGYLKALTELGFDLNGKVHKTVNFTKKSDPNEDVRAIASECYKAVRRHAKKSPSVQDLKRGIIAAEWWLLLCQRQELLGLESVDHEAALKTRRNLMRNP